MAALPDPSEPLSSQPLYPIVVIAVDRGHRGMSQLADRTDGIAILAHRKELIPNLRLARQAQGDRTTEALVVVVLPSGMPGLIPLALASGADRIVVFHTADAPRTRATEVAMRAGGALVDWFITPDYVSLKSAVRLGADADRIDVIDLATTDTRLLYQRIAREPKRREPASGVPEVAASLALDALQFTGLLSLAERFGSDKGVNVVNYHRVLPFQELRTYCRPQMAISAAVFEAQLEAMAQRGFVSIDAIHQPESAGRIAITFDDGYEDNFRVALPMLQRFSAPACVFLVTGLIDEPNACLLYTSPSPRD